MRKQLSLKILTILIVFLASLYIAVPYHKPFLNYELKLGLDLVGGSYLVFEADTSAIQEGKKQEALESLRGVIESRVNLFGVSEPNIQLSSFEKSDKIIVELPGIKNTKDAIDLVGKTAQLQFLEFDEEGNPVPTGLTGANLKSSSVSFDQISGSPVVTLEFDNEGADKFAEITKRNANKQVPIALDSQIISAPVVEGEIRGGSAIIKGDFDLEEAKTLSIQLNAGALPVPIKLVSERTVGASLGEESIQKSLRAGAYGIVLVFLFMIIFYGKLGFVANIGLVVFGVITFALYKMIPVVLTLPGIAGFILSVGMAVDANILIFERFREEKHKGVNLDYALETSFDRAWDSIKDANIATLVTAFILANPLSWSFLHTSGPVRGFAITLGLGIGVSLFTGIFVSRNLLRLIIKEKK